MITFVAAFYSSNYRKFSLCQNRNLLPKYIFSQGSEIKYFIQESCLPVLRRVGYILIWYDGSAPCVKWKERQRGGDCDKSSVWWPCLFALTSRAFSTQCMSTLYSNFGCVMKCIFYKKLVQFNCILFFCFFFSKFNYNYERVITMSMF